MPVAEGVDIKDVSVARCHKEVLRVDAKDRGVETKRHSIPQIPTLML